MYGALSIRRCARSAALSCQALLIVLAIVALACNGRTVTPSRPTPLPTQTPTPATGWTVLGFYEVTMSAAPSCSLPDYATKANYGEARIAQAGQSLDVIFEPYGPFADMGFTGIIDGQTVRFTLNGDRAASGHSFIATVDDVEVAYSGTAAGTKDARGIVATFDGTVRVSLHSDHTVIATCAASDHRMEMVLP